MYLNKTFYLTFRWLVFRELPLSSISHLSPLDYFPPFQLLGDSRNKVHAAHLHQHAQIMHLFIHSFMSALNACASCIEGVVFMYFSYCDVFFSCIFTFKELK